MMDHREAQFIRAYDEYADAIYRHCLFRVYDADRARELMQDTFLRAWTCIAEGEAVDNIRAFLYRIATNLIIDESRKRKTESLEARMAEQHIEPADPQAPTAQHITDCIALEHILAELDPEAQELVRLRYLEGWPPRDIATKLNLTVNVVSVRLHRIMKKLTDRYAQLL